MRWLHSGQTPFCSFQRDRRRLFPVRFRSIFTSRRFSKYVSQAGSKGLAAPCMSVCLWISTSIARRKWTSFVLPSSPLISPVNTQFLAPCVVTYFRFTQVALLRGCLLLAHHHSFLKIA